MPPYSPDPWPERRQTLTFAITSANADTDRNADKQLISPGADHRFDVEWAYVWYSGGGVGGGLTFVTFRLKEESAAADVWADTVILPETFAGILFRIDPFTVPIYRKGTINKKLFFRFDVGGSMLPAANLQAGILVSGLFI